MHIRVQRLRPKVTLTRLPLPLPAYATADAAGMDLMADIMWPICISKDSRVAIPTGIAVAVPSGYELQIRPRSGLALKHGITVANSPGTIDADYRGEIMVILENRGKGTFKVERGDRIAQAVLAPVVQFTWDEIMELDSTARQAGGFGSTGV